MNFDQEYLFEKTGDELSEALYEKVDTFQEHAIRGGFLKNWLKNKRYYENNPYGYNTESILDTGETGELKATSNNQFRNIVRHTIMAAVGSPIAFDCSAANTDVTSRRAAKIGKDLTNFYYKTKRVSKVLAAGAEKAQVYGDGYVLAQWNPFKGQKMQATSMNKGRIEYDGDFDFDSISPFDVFFDLSKNSKKDWEWVIFRAKRNKYVLAKQFESKREAILKQKDSKDTDKYFLRDYLKILYNYNTDDIDLFACYHKENELLPEGKYCLFLAGGGTDSMLYEGVNIYGDKLPLFPLSPSSYLENSFGFTEANVLRGSQEMLNIVDSAMSTNAMATSVINLWTPDTNLEVEQLTDGMNLLKTTQEPKVLNMMANSDNHLKIINYAINNMETQSGQNAISRGNVQSAPNLKSGVAIATVLQMAQQYNSDFINDFYDTAEDLFTFVLEFLQKTAKTKRIYELAGKTRASSVASFTGEDLRGVGRVVVNRVNPIINQPAGAIEIAQQLLQTGTITPRQYLDVINTGNLNVATETNDRFDDYIQNVKEKLLEGKPVAPIPGIDHRSFMAEIQPLLMDLDIMEKPEHRQIVMNITQLLQGHMELVRNGDELSEYIVSGTMPSPPQVSNSEIPMLNQGAPGAAIPGAGKPNLKVAKPNIQPSNMAGAIPGNVGR
jgi:hypothetical protein